VSTSPFFTVGYLNGAGTLTVPFGTSMESLSRGLVNGAGGPQIRVWDYSGVHDPVVTGDVIIVLLMDDTTVNYTIIVNPPVIPPVLVPADLTAYNAALNAVLQADNTPASWAAYQAIVTANMVSPVNTQAQVDAATDAITAAQHGLERVAPTAAVIWDVEMWSNEVPKGEPVSNGQTVFLAFKTNQQV
jgi:hypothetical protein